VTNSTGMPEAFNVPNKIQPMHYSVLLLNYSSNWVHECLTLSDDPATASLLVTGWIGSSGSVRFRPWGQTLCVAMCFFTLDFCEKARPHTTHWKGFSPVWLRKCCCKSKFLANCLLQYLHLNCEQTSWHEIIREKPMVLSCYHSQCHWEKFRFFF
jgi:hypothetical protein